MVDLGTAFTAMTLDVITEYCYDACYNCIEEQGFAPHWKRLMSGLFESVPVAKHFPGVVGAMQSLPVWLAAKLNPDLATFFKARATIHTQARKAWQAEQDSVDTNKAQGEEKPKTIFQGIMRSNIPPAEKSVERLEDEAFVLIVAGAETTARVLTVILSHLLQDRDLFSRIRKEIDGVVKPNLPKSRVLEDLPLTKAIIQEGLRMAAPVTNRQILLAPSEDLKCNGWIIPRGVSEPSVAMFFCQLTLKSRLPLQ